MILAKDHPDLESTIARILLDNGTGILPCDTIYGLVGIAPDTRNKLARIKGREESKKFLMLINNKTHISQYSDISLPADLEKYWPGPLTILFPLRGECGSAGFRIPNDPFLSNLLGILQKPLFSTSVNLSGQSPMSKIKDIIDVFSDRTDFILNRGDMKKSLPSTIIDISQKPYKIVRQGALVIPEA